MKEMNKTNTGNTNATLPRNAGFHGGAQSQQSTTLPGGGFHGGQQNEVTLPGGGFHGGQQNEATLPGGGFH